MNTNASTFSRRFCFAIVGLLFTLVSLTGPNFETAAAQEPNPPGVLINRSTDARSKIANCPSLAILPNGTYIVAHEFYFSNSKKTDTYVFSSKDQGKTWKKVSTIRNQCWPTVFTGKDGLYLISAIKQYSDLFIRRSTDEGKTWTKPTDSQNGILTKNMRAFAIPSPILSYNGKFWRGISKFGNGSYPALVLSVSQDADLLDASNWQHSESVSTPPKLFGGERNRLQYSSVVQSPSGNMFNVMNMKADISRSAAILPLSADGKKLSLDLETAFVEFPSGTNQFCIRYDEQTKRYWSLANRVSDPFSFSNVLTLVSSANLRDWKTETILRQHIDSKTHGFQRSFWLFDGDDIVSVMATAWGSGQYADCITFDRFKNFRELKMKDSAPILGDVIASKYRTDQFEIEANNMKIQPFKVGQQLFSNWTFTIREIPEQFDGWNFTQIMAASKSSMKLTAKRDCEIFFMTGTKQGVIDVTGWKAVENATFKYLSKDIATIGVFKRNIRRGEVIDVPAGSWTGGMVLIPPAN